MNESPIRNRPPLPPGVMFAGGMVLLDESARNTDVNTSTRIDTPTDTSPSATNSPVDWQETAASLQHDSLVQARRIETMEARRLEELLESNRTMELRLTTPRAQVTPVVVVQDDQVQPARDDYENEDDENEDSDDQHQLWKRTCTGRAGFCVGVMAAAVLVVILLVILLRIKAARKQDTESLVQTMGPSAAYPLDPTRSPTVVCLSSDSNEMTVYQAVDAYLDNNNSAEIVALGWPIASWCVSGIEDFSNLFSADRNPRAANFDEALDGWDVSSATTMAGMFQGAERFDQDLSAWNVSSLTNARSLFQGAKRFQGRGLAEWDVSRVTDMSYMFAKAQAFNRETLQWDVSNVRTMEGVFQDATRFNGRLWTWNVSAVTSWKQAFAGASAFNQDVSLWDMTKVATTEAMFQQAAQFNQDLSKWRFTRLETTRDMFFGAERFHQDLSAWDVSTVTDMEAMFGGATLFNGNISTRTSHVLQLSDSCLPLLHPLIKI